MQEADKAFGSVEPLSKVVLGNQWLATSVLHEVHGEGIPMDADRVSTHQEDMLIQSVG